MVQFPTILFCRNPDKRSIHSRACSSECSRVTLYIQYRHYVMVSIAYRSLLISEVFFATTWALTFWKSNFTFRMNTYCLFFEMMVWTRTFSWNSGWGLNCLLRCFAFSKSRHSSGTRLFSRRIGFTLRGQKARRHTPRAEHLRKYSQTHLQQTPDPCTFGKIPTWKSCV